MRIGARVVHCFGFASGRCSGMPANNAVQTLTFWWQLKKKGLALQSSSGGRQLRLVKGSASRRVHTQQCDSRLGLAFIGRAPLCQPACGSVPWNPQKLPRRRCPNEQPAKCDLKNGKMCSTNRDGKCSRSWSNGQIVSLAPSGITSASNADSQRPNLIAQTGKDASVAVDWRPKIVPNAARCSG